MKGFISGLIILLICITAQSFALSPEIKLTASDGAGGDEFGRSVCIDSNRFIVGAWWDDDNGDNSGSAYIFEYNGTTWIEKAKLTAFDGSSSDQFGLSVSIDGDRCIIGAFGDDDNGKFSGSAYIFEFNGTSWIQQTKITASDGAENGYFGYSVSISGDYCIVGAHGSNSAYIFHYNGITWIEQQKLLPLDIDMGFGYSVNIDIDRCIIGAPFDDDNGEISGSAYMFDFNGTTWIEQAKLLPSDGTSGDRFGESVSIDGNCCIVGAHQDDDKGIVSGSAYIFKFNSTDWNETAKLTASDGAAMDNFGISVDINGGCCIIGSWYDDDNGAESGSAYIFQNNGTNWIEQAKLLAFDGAADDYFGYSVSIDSGCCIIGAYSDDNNGGYFSGSVYVWDSSNIPSKAFDPNPEDGETHVDPNVILSWYPGKDYSSHNVYLGTDYNDVNDANASSPEFKGNFDITSFDPCELEIMTTYYWRVDEINDANSIVYKGDIWSFTTGWPLIELSETEFRFLFDSKGDPCDHILTIRNSGESTLNWTIDYDCNWLDVYPLSGSSTGDINQVTLSIIDTNGLYPNNVYTCDLTVSDPNAGNNPQIVRVRVILGQWIITVDDDGPADFDNIQAAIDNAIDGEEIIVADGIYTGTGNRDIDFLGKAITVRSENGAASCIIDLDEAESSTEIIHGFVCQNGEDSNSVINGFTITNGFSLSIFDGAAITALDSDPTITNCILTGNNGFCVIAFRSYNSKDNTVENCTFTNNNTNYVVYSSYAKGGNASVKNSILWDNSGDMFTFIYGKGGYSTTYSYYSVLQSDWYYSENCMIANPCFIDPCSGDYHLDSNSVCINAGDPNYISYPNDIDMDGQPRVLDGRIDIGADEYDPNTVQIQMFPKELFFDAIINKSDPNAQSLSIDVSPPNSVPIDWYITEHCDWLTVEPNSGTWSGEVNEVSVSVDTTGLDTGIYQCLLHVNGPNAIGKTSRVTLTMHGPIIELSQTEFNFGACEGGPNPSDQTLEIGNSGVSTLNWQITEDCNWLTVSPTSGSSTGETNEVVLSVDITGLSVSNYNCDLTISDPNAENNPQTVTVNLDFSDPMIELSENQFDFEAEYLGDNPPDQLLGISNSGGCLLNWQISEDCNWLTVNPVSGSSSGEIDDVNLSVNILGLDKGIYNCELIVSDPNAENNPQPVSINLRIAGPIINLSDNYFYFIFPDGGGNPSDQILGISNDDVGTLNWTIDYDCNWLDVSPLCGSSTGDVNEVILSVNAAGLDPNNVYTCDLTVSDPNAENSPQIVEVIFTKKCFPSEHPDYSEWSSVGEPDCWCNPRQCHGDADGLLHTEKGLTNFWVGVPDLQLLSKGWKQGYSGDPGTDGPDADSDPDTWICADFDHTAHTEKGYTYYYRVGIPDLQRLSTYWKGPNYDNYEPPADCLTDNPVSP